MRLSSTLIVLAAFAVALTASVSPAASQEPDSTSAAAPAPGGMQQEFRRKVGEIVKRQLGLTDAQYQRVVAVNQKYEGQRFMLMQQERELRITIRAEVLRGDSADQKRVGRLLQEIFKVAQQRLDILESEQKDLSAFLTPVQRAKYLGIQEQIRKRLEAMRNQAADGALTPQQQRRLERMRQQRSLPPPAPPPPPPPQNTP